MTNSFSVLCRSGLPFFALIGGIVQPLSSFAGTVALATEPLITTTASPVKPNVLFVLDNSGSMDWEHMPDESGDGGSASTFQFGYYGLRSSQCNQVFYNPNVTYLPPANPDGTNYPDAAFTAARTNGFSGNTNGYGNAIPACTPTSSSCKNLNADFSVSGDGSTQSAYYFVYSGTQTSQLQKNYNSTTNTFYNECRSGQNSSPGKDVFSKRRLSTTMKTTIAINSVTGSTQVTSITVNGVELMSGTSTAASTTTNVASNVAAKITLNGFSASANSGVITITGPASAADYTPAVTCLAACAGTMTYSAEVFPDTAPAKLTNFANWYSFYRSRLLMMKTAAGRAFSELIPPTTVPPTSPAYRVGLMKISQTTPVVPMGLFDAAQRETWYKTLYNMITSGSTPLRTALSNAGWYFAGKLTGTDPVQYSCQQNFTILSTDGYWNTGDGFDLSSSPVGNQDGDKDPPMNDGKQAGTTVTTTYTRNTYSSSSCSCSWGKKKIKTQPQTGTCSITTVSGVVGPESCTWVNNGSSSCSGTCANSVTLPIPNPSNRVQVGTPTTTAGAVGGTSDTLADIAMYYYQTPLRSSALGNCGTGNVLCPSEPNVPKTALDDNANQHMTTFTLGLGASGWMNYSSGYLTDTTGDYVSVKLKSTADSTASPPICSWQADGTACTWPLPGMSGSNGLIANVDDLWHAAVNGHGVYFSATDPTTLSSGLANALAGVKSRRATAAAAATSTLNPVAGNNYAYVASYTTVKWIGNLEARGINTDTGGVNVNASWCAEDVVATSCPSPNTLTSETTGDTTTWYCVHPNTNPCENGIQDGTSCKIPAATACTGTMKSSVLDFSDTRTIKTASADGATLINFDSAYAASNASYFNAAHIGTMTQWSSLTDSQKTAAAGANLVSFLRGQYGYEDRNTNSAENRLYRQREGVLGDILESQPAFLAAPMFSYPYRGYSDFVTAQSSRAGTVYVSANDGMMHAFNGDTGSERWAYVPSMVIPNLWQLADTSYSANHKNFINGSPVTSDICVANCASTSDPSAPAADWRTILVAGLNGGGRGYFALDITDPNAPTLLWEFTTTGGIGKTKDDDLGYSYGTPIVTRKADGTWVVLVTSGYNNVSPGSGKAYLYVLNAYTGAIISKILADDSRSSAASAATPSGLAKISAWNTERKGNKVGYVYGGDLLGNLWRFDVNSTASATVGTGSALLFAQLKNASGTAQPITTTPALGLVKNKRVVFVGTGKYLESSDSTDASTQSLYAIKDDNNTATFVNPRTALVAQTLTNAGNTRTGSTNAVNFTTEKGWYVDFPVSKERVNIDPKLLWGTLFVATIVPESTDCEPGGYGWLNYFDYATGQPIVTATATVSIRTPSPIVGMNAESINGKPGLLVEESDGDGPKVPPGDLFHLLSMSYTGKRVTWRELIP